MNSLSPALGRARLLALLVPVIALGTAYASQYLGGLHPVSYTHLTLPTTPYV